ncbi:MAG: histidine phosphatase family protein [Candidatus Aenigmatarchaeota archaeon]
MAKLYLVRHGSSVEQGMIRGRMPGYPLSEKGRREAAIMADWMADRDIAAIFSSPLQRAYETAQYVAREKRLNIKLSEQLSEWHAPLWQGKHWGQLNKLQVLRYALRPATLNLNGETLGEVAERMAAFLRSVAAQGKDAVCVSHRDCIIAGKLMLLGKSLNRLNFGRCKPASVTVLEVGEEAAKEVEYFEP